MAIVKDDFTEVGFVLHHQARYLRRQDVGQTAPAEKLAVSVTVMKGPKSPAGNSAQSIAERISDTLAPGHALKMR
ncbi:hypothetical protein [Streptomyces sp. NPDC096339]|uniref:hypothetical protein n=1 Tax=Streptomyces sp. NPDC096339 TaxID=3366086 RepID=UPI0038141BF5